MTEPPTGTLATVFDNDKTWRREYINEDGAIVCALRVDVNDNVFDSEPYLNLPEVPKPFVPGLVLKYRYYGWENEPIRATVVFSDKPQVTPNIKLRKRYHWMLAETRMEP